MVLWTHVDGKLIGGQRIRFYLAARNEAIVSASIDADGHTCTEEEFLWQCRTFGHVQQARGANFASAAAAQVEEYLKGRRREFDLLLHYRGTNFQTAVWKALTQIPFGQTRTYGEVAEIIGNPGAMRAVGQANRRNSIPLIVPCHRVTAAGGKLGGFAGGTEGGARLKRALLEHEMTVSEGRGKLKATA